MKKKKLLVLLLLIIILSIFIYFNNSNNRNIDNVDKVDREVGKILKEYGYDESFKDKLRNASENFTYDPKETYEEALLRLEEYLGDLSIIYENMDRIPDIAIWTLLNSPENFFYTLGFIKGYNNGNRIDFKDHIFDIPYIMQTDPKWAYYSYGDSDIAIAGCGPTVMSMVASHIKHNGKYTPKYMADLAIENNWYVEGVGTEWSFMKGVADILGFEGEELPLDRNTILQSIDRGDIIVLSLGPGDFTNSGHYIIVNGYEDGGFYVLDPNSWVNSEKIWPYSRIESQIRNIWAFR